MIVCKVFATPKRKDIEPANMQGCWLFINLFKIKGIIFFSVSEQLFGINGTT